MQREKRGIGIQWIRLIGPIDYFICQCFISVECLYKNLYKQVRHISNNVFNYSQQISERYFQTAKQLISMQNIPWHVRWYELTNRKVRDDGIEA